MKRVLNAILAVLLLLSLSLVTYAGNDPCVFSDVPQTSWFAESVQYVAQNGIMNGTGANQFSPHTPTSRGMIVTILFRLSGQGSTNDDMPFDDVKRGSYYEDAIRWAAGNRIVSGYGNRKFGPDDSITREQLAAILYRYANYMGYDTSDRASINGFSDFSEISTFSTTAMSWSYAMGLIQGSSSAKLMPKGNAERCQVAAILMRFAGSYNGQAEMPEEGGNDENNDDASNASQKPSIDDDTNETDNLPVQSTASENRFYVSSQNGTVGDTITVRLSLEGKPKLCDFQMELSFDNEILQLIEIDDQLDMDIVSNGIQERGIVKLNFSRAKNTTKGGNLIDMTFKVIKKPTDGQTQIQLGRMVKIDCVDSNESIVSTDYCFTAGVVTIS